MDNKIKSLLTSPGFLSTLALCLAVVGVGGYFLLFDGGTPSGGQTQVSAPVARMPVEPVTQTPKPDPAPMPEEPVMTVEPEPLPAETTAEPAAPVEPVEPEPPSPVVAPLQGEVVSAFSMDALVYDPTLEDWRTHDGIDIAGAVGTQVMAASAGTVSAITNDPLMGTTVVIRHGDGAETTYANLQAQPTVEAGDHVSAGQIIGAVGTTAAAEAAQAAHLHFSVTRDGQPIDPETYLNGG